MPAKYQIHRLIARSFIACKDSNKRIATFLLATKPNKAHKNCTEQKTPRINLRHKPHPHGAEILQKNPNKPDEWSIIAYNPAFNEPQNSFQTLVLKALVAIKDAVTSGYFAALHAEKACAAYLGVLYHLPAPCRQRTQENACNQQATNGLTRRTTSAFTLTKRPA
jgi:hypothetical protein